MLNYGTENTGEFLPYLGFNAKSDKWFLNVEKEKLPLKGDIVFVADIENIETGWFKFSEGMAPDIALDASLEQPIDQPSGKHKRGARLKVFMKGEHPGVYEFSTNSKNVMMALSDLHDSFLDEKEKNKDKLPVINVLESSEVKSSFKNDDGTPGTATNYRPNFSIEKWVDRPIEFDQTNEEDSPAPAGEPVSEF